MKILESQSAVLTNYEVFTHLTEQRARYEAGERKRRGPGNLETVVREMLDYLRAVPSPLGSTPLPYNGGTIRTLLTRLRPYNLTKAEFIIIMNLRPTQSASLNVAIEELEQRFPNSTDQEDMIRIIAEVLGSPDEAAERQAMTEDAKDARDRQQEEGSEEFEHGTEMEVDG